MQVRKFEAKTIKEAIELVKFHMGPEAIILSAKDNGKNFGLMGQSSVEVTAAVSEVKLNQKNQAEKKLNERNKIKYQGASARSQKEYIDKVFSAKTANFIEDEQRQARKPAAPPVPKVNGITAARYADITEENAYDQYQSAGVRAQQSSAHRRPIDGERLPASYVNTNQSMARAATSPIQQTAPRASAAHMSRAEGSANGDMNLEKMQNEINYLKNMLQQFQSVPQNMITYHPGAEEGLPYELSFIFKRLLDAGMKQDNIVELLKIANEELSIDHKKKKPYVDGWVIKYLLEHIQTVDKAFKSKYQIFVGPTGQGKTSTVIKIACHLMMNEKKKVAILSGDHVKVGADDQLKIYAQIMNVPCGKIRSPADWSKVEDFLKDVDYVLLDTPGVNLRNEHDYRSLRDVLPDDMSDMQVHYVQSAVARDLDAFEVAERFRFTNFEDVIFTRLDEAVQHGIIYNFQKRFHVPLHSFGIGSGVPEHFELASKERVVDLLLNLSKIKKERGIV